MLYAIDLIFFHKNMQFVIILVPQILRILSSQCPIEV